MDFMAIAIEEARKAARRGEVPVGAVIVCRGKVIARAHNKRERKQNALAHAEVLAIDKACRRLGSWRLDNCEMYVTLEPCAMCAGAIVNARIRRVVFGARTSSDLNWVPESVFEERVECGEIIKDFFAKRR